MTTKEQKVMAEMMAARQAAMTPYDTGKRAEAKVWEKRHIEDDGDYGKVDFNAEDDYTIATLYIERDEDGTYAVRGYANETLKFEVDMEDR